MARGSRRSAVAAAVASVLIAQMSTPPALAAVGTSSPSLDSLARDVDRAESVRDVKTLQRTYAQYAQYGLWNEMSALFAKDGVFQHGDRKLEGPAAINDYLTRTFGNGRQGLPSGPSIRS